MPGLKDFFLVIKLEKVEDDEGQDEAEDLDRQDGDDDFIDDLEGFSDEQMLDRSDFGC